MRILIRKVNTNLYLSSGDWIADANQAQDFRVGSEAIVFALKHDLNNVEIVYAFPSVEYDFTTGTMGFTPKRRFRQQPRESLRANLFQ